MGVVIRRLSFLFTLGVSSALAPFALAPAAHASAGVAAVVAASTTTPSPAPPVTDNVFLPQSEDIGTCIGTLERPGCGSKAKGDFRQYLTFLALILGMAFIGWRITVGIRQRDRDHTKPNGNTF